ncbi:hypothetical protein [Actinacidiphila oryziradicis]|uniref:Uncharacterized protein n=1 Tax=Actinacidiphila oryziradicis TaxID=2571141 RepID=A0A4U0RXW6_9ACTN|nr:hypothetical protein [Actinacidiphila oryziradicis]TKA00498.1 hypothetical protein FCI23_42645 [Actinacidiphila oryziradicis]
MRLPDGREGNFLLRDDANLNTGLLTISGGCRSFEGVWHERDLRVRDPAPLRRVSYARPLGADADERVLWETDGQVGRDGRRGDDGLDPYKTAGGTDPQKICTHLG